MDERPTYEVHSPAHVAAMLRTLIADLQDKPGDGPVFIGEPDGAPAAVLLPFAAYQSFQQAAQDARHLPTSQQPVPETRSPAHAAAMLRTLIADLQDKPGDGPVFIGEPDGAPAAVLLPFAAYQSFQQAAEEMEDRDIARIVAERPAPAPGEGLDNEALARFVQDEPDTT